MTWVQTTGKRAVDLLDPKPEQIDLEDIAWSLARQCRFNGHTILHYSVAEHSTLVSLILGQQKQSREVQLAGLLHDAAEAYLGDIVSPVKRCLSDKAWAELDGIDRTLSRAIYSKFGLDPNLVGLVAILQADLEILRRERDFFFPHQVRDWGIGNAVTKIPVNIQSHQPIYARDVFIERAQELGLEVES